MDNSAYVPSHMPSPALVVFSQAAGGLTEALRIQRPFHSQMGDGKEMHLPFGLRHMEAAYGAHLLHQLPPQFLHPSPFGTGAFRPLGSGPGPSLLDAKHFPSAFAPPTPTSKCSSPMMIDHHHHQQSQQAHHQQRSSLLFSSPEERLLGALGRRTDSCSPASASLSPPAAVKEESMEGGLSEEGDCRTPGPQEAAEQQQQERAADFRLGSLLGTHGALALAGYNFGDHAAALSAKTRMLFEQGSCKKSVLGGGSACCPVCGASLQAGELEGHFVQELERLYKLSAAPARARRHEAMLRPNGPTGVGCAGDPGPDGRWETFQRIKTNRQSRLRIKARKRKVEDTACPVCHSRMPRSPEELTAHVEMCIRKHNGANSMNVAMGTATDEDEPVDVEGDSESFEDVASWCDGQRRPRASTLLAGLTSSTATPSSSDQPVEESDPGESVDLVVDGDEGEGQATPALSYHAEDSDGPREKKERRKDLNSSDRVQSQEPIVNSSMDVQPAASAAEATPCDTLVTTSDAEPSSRAQVLEELRARIRELEGDSTSITEIDDQPKCTMCGDSSKRCQQCTNALAVSGAQELRPMNM